MFSESSTAKTLEQSQTNTDSLNASLKCNTSRSNERGKRLAKLCVKASQFLPHIESGYAKGLALNHVMKAAKFNLNCQDDKVMSAIISGIERRKSLLNDLTQTFFDTYPGEGLRNDHHLYICLFYICIIRLFDVGFEDVKSMLSNVYSDTLKIPMFLRFCCGHDQEESDSWAMTRVLLRHLDVSYVESHILLPIKRQRKQWMCLCRRLNRSLNVDESGLNQSSSSSFNISLSNNNITTPKPFNLSANKLLGISVAHPEYRIATNHPRTCIQMKFMQPRLKLIEKRKAARKYRIREMLIRNNAQLNTFESRVNQRIIMKSDQRQSELRQRQAQEHTLTTQSKSHRAQRVSINTSSSNLVNVRVNRATVLREAARIKLIQTNEAQSVAEYEACLHDAAEYHEWRQAMTQLDEETRDATIETRRINVKQHQSVVSSSISLLQLQARKNKKLMNKCFERAREEKSFHDSIAKYQQIIRNREIRKSRNKSLLAVKNLIQLNNEKANTIRREKAELSKQRHDLLSEELHRNQNICRESQVKKAMSKERRANDANKFDSTSTANHMLLCEIPMSEMKKRRQCLNKMNDLEHEEKKMMIANTKFARAKGVQKYAQLVLATRSNNMQISNFMRAEKRAQTEHNEFRVNRTKRDYLSSALSRLHTTNLETFRANENQNRDVKRAEDIKLINKSDSKLRNQHHNDCTSKSLNKLMISSMNEQEQQQRRIDLMMANLEVNHKALEDKQHTDFDAAKSLELN